jgi:hypothetical protein
LQIIPSEHNFDFHRRSGEMCRTNPCLDGPTHVWSRKGKYYEYVIDENYRPMFGFIDASW